MYERYLKHKPDGVSDEIKNFVNETVFGEVDYIFYTRIVGGFQEAYCTHCNNKWITNGLKHNEENVCPNCEKQWKSKSSGMGRRSLSHRATFLWYEKSQVDKEVVIARGFHVERDFTRDFKEVENRYIELAFYIFEPGKSTMLVKDYYWRGWEKRSSIFNFNINGLATLPYFYSIENIYKAIGGTCLKYSAVEEFKRRLTKSNSWASYKLSDMLRYFELYNKYPNIEKIIKIGLGELVYIKLEGGFLGRNINWRGKDVYKMLKMNKGDLREITGSNINVTPMFLSLYQINVKYKQRLTISEVKDLEYIVMYANYVEVLKKILKYTTITKAYKYINKQFKNRNDKEFSSANGVLTTWRDYLQDCKKLNIDLTIESNIMPKNLYNAHQNTIKQIKYNDDLEIMKKTKERMKELEKYKFQYEGLLIRAPKTSKEIIKEGKIQHICVGGYAKRHADGATNILFIRKVDKPNEPFYTVEVNNNNKVVQVRGKRNIEATEEVKKFMEVFKAEKLDKKIKNKIIA